MGLTLTEQEIRDIIKKMSSKKVIVLGDFYLDQNIVGSMEAISREAPVPIVRVTSDDYHPGGGGNTVVDVAALGIEVIPIGIIGNDLHGDIFFQELKKRNIASDFVIREERRRTPTFNKIWASSFQGRPQQVARYDIENFEPTLQKSIDVVISSLQRLLPDVDAILVNDYDEVGNIGIITDKVLDFLCEIGKTSDVIITADSRQNIGKCKNFTAVVPNEIETAAAVGYKAGDENIRENGEVINKIGKQLQSQINADFVIVTRGDLGATIFTGEHDIRHVGGFPVEGEIDITGAGDMFASTLTGALCAGVDIAQAVELANLAASIVVKKLWTTGTATPDEILQAANRFFKIIKPMYNEFDSQQK